MCYRVENESYLERLEGNDRTVAECHLHEFGEIYVDEYGFPIDDPMELATIEKERKG